MTEEVPPQLTPHNYLYSLTLLLRSNKLWKLLSRRLIRVEPNYLSIQKIDQAGEQYEIFTLLILKCCFAASAMALVKLEWMFSGRNSFNVEQFFASTKSRTRWKFSEGSSARISNESVWKLKFFLYLWITNQLTFASEMVDTSSTT